MEHDFYIRDPLRSICNLIKMSSTQKNHFCTGDRCMRNISYVCITFASTTAHSPLILHRHLLWLQHTTASSGPHQEIRISKPILLFSTSVLSCRMKNPMLRGTNQHQSGILQQCLVVASQVRSFHPAGSLFFFFYKEIHPFHPTNFLTMHPYILMI